MKTTIRVGDIVKIAPRTKCVQRVGYKYDPREFRWILNSLVNILRLPDSTTKKEVTKRLSSVSAMQNELESLTEPFIRSEITDPRIATAAIEYWKLARSTFYMLKSTMLEKLEQQRKSFKSNNTEQFKLELFGWDLDDRVSGLMIKMMKVFHDESFAHYLLPHTGNERKIYYGSEIDTNETYVVVKRQKAAVGERVVEWDSDGSDYGSSYEVRSFALEKVVHLISLVPLKERSCFITPKVYRGYEAKTDRKYRFLPLDEFLKLPYDDARDSGGNPRIFKREVAIPLRTPTWRMSTCEMFERAKLSYYELSYKVVTLDTVIEHVSSTFESPYVRAP